MTVISELVIARHGEAACNIAGIAGGERGCTGLTPRGWTQAEQVARRLAAEHRRRAFDVLHTSPRLRARQTAEVIGDHLGLTPAVADDLRGPDHGAGDGGNWGEIRTAFGGHPRRYPDRQYASGSETWNQYLDRFARSLNSLLDRYTGQRILIVGHRESVEAAHVAMLGLRMSDDVRYGFSSDHASLARWEHYVDKYGHLVWRLVAHNDGRHLEA